ncbi:MAG: GtrA family protein [Bacteroidales bacterium]|nr:GtrA family protein [Bacteroidales bacterium]MCM1147769.1 GtrA family protein [Bacteroidales bacterium]MCM1206621.1 GtrA family protein [Bacillota bacterium]
MGRNGVKEFSKAQVSSLLSTFCDFISTAGLFSLTRHVVASTAFGAFVGGAVNCAVNYYWTFRGTCRTKKGVVCRYVVVWLGSMALNTAGTEWGVRLVRYSGLWTDQDLGLVMMVKAVVAVIVAVAWNFTIQKYYVYKK